ncbi:WD40 repeat-like protein [Trichoderma asperelloides]|nr:WD40 repeat-like protein [Trichoderma asperelloides]
MDPRAALAGNIQALEGHSDWVRCCCYSPDGRLIVSGGDDGLVRLWSAETFKVQHTFNNDPKYNIKTVRFSPDGALMAYTQGPKIFLWDMKSDKGRCLSAEHTDYIDGLAFWHNSKYLASASHDRTVRVWVTCGESGKESNETKSLCILEGHEDYVNCVSFSSDSCRLASGSSDLTIRIWTWSGYENPNYAIGGVLRGHGHSTNISFVAFAPDGRMFASASSDGKICLWDCNTGHIMCSFSEHEANITWLDFSYDGDILVSASQDGTARVWDTRRRAIKHRLRGH